MDLAIISLFRAATLKCMMMMMITMTLHVRLSYLYQCAKFRSRTLAGFCCTLADAEEEEEEDDDADADADEESTRAIPAY